MNKTTIYVGIGVLVIIIIIVAVIMSKKTVTKPETKTETIVKEGCNLGYESVNGVCNFVACPSGFYNDLNEKKCKRRTKVCAPERPCETVTENPNADECIKDISRCACDFGFYKNSAGVCTPYSQSVIDDYNANKSNNCKNVSLDPNADRVIISNKPNGTICKTEGAYEYSCVDGQCSNKRCAPSYYDRGDGTCIDDCKNNGSNNIINDTVNRRCVASCPSETYYNKIVNGSQIVKNECVRDCSSVRTKDFFGRDTSSFNFRKTNGLGYCINCSQDQQYKNIEGVTPQIQNLNDIALVNATNSYKTVYNDTELNNQILLSSAHMNFYTNSCLNFS
jgi:hypothetical protein